MKNQTDSPRECSGKVSSSWQLYFSFRPLRLNSFCMPSWWFHKLSFLYRYSCYHSMFIAPVCHICNFLLFCSWKSCANVRPDLEARWCVGCVLCARRRCSLEIAYVDIWSSLRERCMNVIMFTRVFNSDVRYIECWLSESVTATGPIFNFFVGW